MIEFYNSLNTVGKIVFWVILAYWWLRAVWNLIKGVGKIEEDCRAMNGAEQDRGDSETVAELRKYLKEAFAVICDDCETKVCEHCVRNMRWRKAIEGAGQDRGGRK